MRDGLTILMYHRVLPEGRCAEYPLASLAMPEDDFRVQLDWLVRHCDVLPVAEAVERSVRRTDRPVVSLTFDDGYADNAAFVAPELEARGVRGTFFVTTGFVERGEALWFDVAADAWSRMTPESRSASLRRLSGETGSVSGAARAETLRDWMESLKRAEPSLRHRAVRSAAELSEGTFRADLYRPMTVDDVIRLHRRGHEVGAHTVSHPILPQLGDAELRLELSASRSALRSWTGGEVRGFCYPNGDTDARVESAVRDAGFAYACTTRPGRNLHAADSMKLSRTDVTVTRVRDHRGRFDEISFRAEVSGLRESWRAVARRLGLGAA